MPSHHIRCFCNNAAVIVMMNKHTSTHLVAMHLLRCLFFICARFNITLSVEHTAGIKHDTADALSRNNLSSFLPGDSFGLQNLSEIHPEILMKQNLIGCQQSGLALFKPVSRLWGLAYLTVVVLLY